MRRERLEGYRLLQLGLPTEAPLLVTVADEVATVTEFWPLSERAVAVKERHAWRLSNDVTARIRSAFDDSACWSADPFVDLEGDATMWMVEARERERYKVVTRVRVDATIKNPVDAMLAASKSVEL